MYILRYRRHYKYLSSIKLHIKKGFVFDGHIIAAFDLFSFPLSWQHHTRAEPQIPPDLMLLRMMVLLQLRYLYLVRLRVGLAHQGSLGKTPPDRFHHVLQN